MRTSSRPLWFYRIVAGVFVAGAAVLAASAQEVRDTRDTRDSREYMGYTQVGDPDHKGAKVDRAAAIRLASESKGVGVTIRYLVLDRQAKRDKTGRGDTFGTGWDDFDNFFVPGKDFQAGRHANRPRLDTNARYLYLYQVFNDSGYEGAVRSVTIRLIIEPQLITSWGYFARNTEVAGKRAREGLGFAVPTRDEKAGATRLVAFSTDDEPVGGSHYTHPAPAKPADRPYSIKPITLGEDPPAAEAARLVADTGDQPGRRNRGTELEDVFIVENVYFERDDVWSERSPLRLRDADLRDGEETRRLRDGIDDTRRLRDGYEDTRRLRDGLDETRRLRDGVDEPRRGARVADWRKRWPAIRATWRHDNMVMKNERSTLYGFTSDYPPKIQPALLGSRIPSGIILGAGKADGPGKVVPAPFEKKADGKKGDEKKDIPAAGEFRLLDAVTAARMVLPALGEELPTPFRTVADITEAAASTGAAPVGGLPLSSTGGLGGQPGGGAGGFPTASPGAGQMAGRGSGGGGGATGGGSGGGDNGTNPNQQGTQGENQNQNQGQGGTTISNNVTVTVQQSQSQKQQQQQKQKQQQQQQQQQHQKNNGGGNGEVIPAPPAWLLGVLGLPVFAFLARRRKPQAADATPDNPPA